MPKFVDVGDALIHVDHIKRLRPVKGLCGQVSFVVETIFESGGRWKDCPVDWGAASVDTQAHLSEQIHAWHSSPEKDALDLQV